MRKSNRQNAVRRAPRARAFALSLLFVGCALGAASAADIASIPRSAIAPSIVAPSQTGLVTCQINGTVIGDIEIGIEDGKPYISSSLLAGMLSARLRPEAYEAIFSAAFSGLEWIGEPELSQVGIGMTWDPATIMYSLKIPPSYAPLKDLDFTLPVLANIKPILKPSPLSGHIDLLGAATVRMGAPKISFPLQAEALGTFNLLGWILEGDAVCSLDESVSDFSLQALDIVHDIPGINGRLYLGMVTAPGRAYMSQPQLYGFTLNRVVIRPYRARFGTGELPSEFTLETPSTVRIIINGLVYRSMMLIPGNYRILDLPFTFGLNEFVLEIEDAEGHIKRQEVQVPRDSGLLAMGDSDYGISAGVGRTETDQVFGSAFFRHAFGTRFTGGIQAQADMRSLLFGIHLVQALPIGTFTGIGNAVYAWDGRTYAWSGSANFQYDLKLPGSAHAPSFGLFAEYFSPGFATPLPVKTVSPMNEYLKIGAQMNGQMSDRTSFGLGGYWSRNFLPGSKGRFNLNFAVGQGIGGGINLSLLSSLAFEAGATPDFAVTFMLFSTDLSRNRRSFNMIQSLEGTNSFNYSDRLESVADSDVSIRGQNLIFPTGETSSVGTGLRNSGRFGDVGLDFDYYFGNPLIQDRGEFKLSLGTSLAFAGGHMAFSRRIYDSFVMFAPVGEMKNETVYARLDGSQTIASPNAYPIVMPLTSYRPSIGYMDLPEATLDKAPRVSVAMLSPGYKSGVTYESDILRRYMVLGRLIDTSGKPLGFIAGDVMDFGGMPIISTFTDEEGRFEVYDLIPGKYLIAWPDFVGSTEFEVKETETGAIDLGDVGAAGAAR